MTDEEASAIALEAARAVVPEAMVMQRREIDRLRADLDEARDMLHAILGQARTSTGLWVSLEWMVLRRIPERLARLDAKEPR